MGEDDDPPEGIDQVQTANGSFLEAYQNGVLEFISFVERVGNEGIAKHRLTEEDRILVERGISTLKIRSKEIFRIQSRAIGSKEPSFWEESLVESFWSILSGVFLVAHHAGVTESAKQFANFDRTSAAVEGKRAKKVARAESVRMIIETAERRRDGRLKNPAFIRGKMEEKLGHPIDEKTARGYVTYIDQNGKSVGSPDEIRED